MPWIVGIDEAGYGPNLGPFVMSSVACRVPEGLTGADLWQVLQQAVRRAAMPDDGRILVEDSKLVYSTARGLAGLETGVLTTVGGPGDAATLADYLERLCPGHREVLAGDCWYTGTTPVPAAVVPGDLAGPGERFREACRAGGVEWGCVRSVLVCPARFNALLDRWGSKGAVLGEAFGSLVACNHRPDMGDEPVFIHVDKHGGRNTYAAMLQEALPGGFVAATEEGMARSSYRVHGLGRDLQVTFQPRADAEHFCVALASMVSKYLRELLMREFNAFWCGQVPDLKPTAGYPGDAARFFQAIRPALARLGLPEAAVWRRK